jgi:AcrR family transcriptional regulator
VGGTPAVDLSTRDRLLDAAAQVFCERGYEGTTVSLVARRVGLTTGAIYANFRDKAELLLQTIGRRSGQALADMEAARQAGVSAANRLLLMSRRLVTDPDPMQRQLIVEMFTAARRDADVGHRVADSLAAMEHELVRLMDRAKADGDVGREWDAAVLARFCMALGVGFTHLKTAGLADPDPTAWEALTSHLVSSLAPQEPDRGS